MSEQSKYLEKRFEQGLTDMVPDEKIRRIILHSVDVFARKGLTATKIKEIAQNAGFSQGFIYNYFKSKDEIFIKISKLAAEGAGNAVKYATELDGTPYQRIYWLTEAFLSPDSIAMQHWRLIMLQSTTSEAVPQKAKQAVKAKITKPFEYLVPLIMEGQKCGEITKADPMMLAVTYFSIIQGLGITRIQCSNDIPFPSTDLVLSFLRKV